MNFSQKRGRTGGWPSSLGAWLFAGTLGCAALSVSRDALALVDVGADVGLIKRSADTPNNLDVGVAYGVHGDFDLLPMFKVGPYYLHYGLGSADSGALAGDATFNTLGLRARFTLPVPGSIAPYAFVGAGYTWVSYAQPLADRGGHFVEIPVGAGIAWNVWEFVSVSLDGAYRPGVGFGGDAFDRFGVTHPSSGWSAMLSASIGL